MTEFWPKIWEQKWVSGFLPWCVGNRTCPFPICSYLENTVLCHQRWCQYPETMYKQSRWKKRQGQSFWYNLLIFCVSIISPSSFYQWEKELNFLLWLLSAYWLYQSLPHIFWCFSLDIYTLINTSFWWVDPLLICNTSVFDIASLPSDIFHFSLYQAYDSFLCGTSVHCIDVRGTSVFFLPVVFCPP